MTSAIDARLLDGVAVGLSPLDSVSMAVMSPRNDFVMNYRRPDQQLTPTQAFAMSPVW